MGDINSNEYVRTMDGKIGVFVRYSSRKDDSLYKSPANCFIRLNNRKSDLQCFRDYIIKHSKNIIDLIEVGDVVRFKELAIDEKYGTIVNQIYILDIHDNDELSFMKEEIERKAMEILSIVTKEQFASMEYKVKEE